MPVYKALDLVTPAALSHDRRLSAPDKAFHLQLLADGEGTISMHARRMGVSYSTAHRAAIRLIQYDWAQALPRGDKTHIAPAVPIEVENKVAERMMWMRDSHPPVGEFLLKCILCLLIPDRNYYDNIRPPFMVDGHGGGRLELDRLYESARIAFEYQGAQHFQAGGPLGITDKDLEEQVNRDRVKAALCAQEGIQLIWFTIDDLSISRVRERLDGFVPVSPVRENRPIARTIERMCRSVVNYAKKRDS